MSMNEQMNHAEESILHTYNRFPVMFDHGEGCYLYDTEGKKYLDFAAGIAVNALGYHYPGYDDALKSQIDKLTHISNLYYNEPMSEAGEKLIKASGLSKAFFTNSGTEAIEGALKAARKYSYTKYGKEAGRFEIIAMNHSFHGRSMGALSVTGTEHYREPFEPLIGGVKFADFNDLESVKAQITDKTCAVITEVVQGEGGIYPAQKEFLEGLRALCDEKDIILIFDEIQCGMGRTGYYFAWQSYGVQPDVMTCAKALGCGVPVGAFVLGEKAAAASLVPGDHGTTYGGNPFVCAAVSKVFDIFEQDNILAHVQELTPYLEEKLDALVDKYPIVAARRGKGFMQGLVIEGTTVGSIVTKALANGLLVISAGSDVLRLVPPLVITKEHINEMIEKLEKSLA
ncbi:aspartate aminotransferase family protein [Blautia obeum]|uniref:Acetylornithine aminotransferase n=1 Tax=Blautia obeum TaxID=40520 RepID=A0A3E5EKX9_9FIRM|nr:aspartate aminotransferase family protein [Blautia obeum]RGN89482.1 aspartate aminotransferase family protein [Blautia obeum]RHE11810.1 aspartate aminotransferase family protein [Blautia obeum]RHH17883.1 aspartate aminotransferase family protein [Blautia obeum]